MRKGSDVDKIALLYTTWPDAETAEKIARAAVEHRLCACVNIFPAARSVYRWDNRIEAAAEIVAVFKTTAAKSSELSDFIVAEHPYEVPAVVALADGLDGTAGGFADWIREQVI